VSNPVPALLKAEEKKEKRKKEKRKKEKRKKEKREKKKRKKKKRRRTSRNHYGDPACADSMPRPCDIFVQRSLYHCVTTTEELVLDRVRSQACGGATRWRVVRASWCHVILLSCCQVVLLSY
jgi:hypothetical protein